MSAMSYEASPVQHRRGGPPYDGYSRSKFGDGYDRPSRDRSGPRETNGFPPSRHTRNGDRYDDRSGGSRYPSDRRGRAPSPKPSRVLGVFGLSLRTEERHLYDVMSVYGPLEDIQIVYDNLSGRSRGFGFVYFQNLEDARAAQAACARGLELHDRVLRVDYSLTTGPHQPTPGVYMGKDKRRNFNDRGRRFGGGGYSDNRRPPRSTFGYRRSRSPPPRRRDDYPPSPYRRRSRVVSSSRSRSPPPVYGNSSGRGGRDDTRGRSRGSADRFDTDGRFPPLPKGTREWSGRSSSPR